MKNIIYADNAATTKLDIDAFRAMKPFLLEDFSNPSQVYSFSRSSKNAIKTARSIIADCIGASPEEIYFTSGGTESDNWAIKKAISLKNGGKNGIITSTFEHHAILNTCEALADEGHSITYINPDKNGIIKPRTMKDGIGLQTHIVSVMMANNEIGTIQPVEELAQIAHENGALFHTDAVQCIGHIPVDVKKLNVDMLSASAHKFNGPKGIGFLYLKNGVELSPLIHGGSQENMHRAGTENVASIIGMAIALKNNNDDMYKNIIHIKELEKCFISKLNDSNVDYIRNGGGDILPGLISLSFNGQDGEALLHMLDLQGICVSTGSACDGVNKNISHVIKAISLNEEYAKGTIRVSLGKNNTYDEVKEIAKKLITIVQYRT